MIIRRILVGLLPLLVAGCGSDTPSSPSSSSSTTTTVAPASVSETYKSTLPVGGSKFYSFTVAANGTVNLSLASLTAPDITDDMGVSVDLSIGTPAGLGCTPSTTVTVSTQTAAPQITGTYAPGVYCVRIADTTTILPEPAAFSIAIEHS
jgi:hypothetical protein